MRIGIIGGSSQVGSSLALYFKHFSNTDVVCFVRSTYSTIFFELFDIAFDKIDFNDSEKLQQQFQGLDAVIDCSYPAVQLYDILPAIRRNLNAIITAMPESAIFIYMSSIMAYGMPPEEKYVKHYAIPRSSYAYIKRQAEREVVRLCEKYDRKGYNFRLSQVHGFLQSVSNSFRGKLSISPAAYISGSAQELTNTIFINSVCAAVLKCVSGEVKPGLYTLVSQPQWTLEELYTYYTVHYDIDSRLHFFDEKARPLRKESSFISAILGRAKKYRPMLETYVLLRLPNFFVELKGRYRQSEVYRTVNSAHTTEPIHENLLGPPPLATINSIESSVTEVAAHEKKMEDFYNKIIAGNRK